jgi:type IV pilus assembly protein PilY1
MKSSIIISKKKHGMKRFILVIVACLAILAAGSSVNAAPCIDLADIPLDALEQAAPGLIMFVLDDSGSMDWSFMTPPGAPGESSGLFKGYYYVFSNAGDDVYNAPNLEDNTADRMMWMSQWSGYNGMYYNPDTEYTPWPTFGNADIDNPRSAPTTAGNTLDMTLLWHEWALDDGLIVDNSDATGFVASAGWTNNTGGWNNNYLHAGGTEATVTATWTANNLDPSTTYDVYARWLNGGTSRLTDVHYRTFDDTAQVADTGVNQQLNFDVWMPIATNVTFSTGIGVVSISEPGGASQVCADAVKFVPTNNPVSDIARRHYYVQNASGTYLVNLLNGVIEYYRVNLVSTTDNRETVTTAKLARLTDTEAGTAGILTGRTFTEEIQNFANWYSFYRRRELTAKNAIAKSISTMDGVYVGIISINGNLAQRVLPVRVTLDSVLYDDSASLLATLYGLTINAQGTPLRNGLKNAGRFFQGNYLKPSTFSSYTSSATYPFFLADKGGTCQQAFTIIFTDGFYNGSDPGIGDADSDNNTDFDGPPFADGAGDTLADVAMYYFENDLNSNLINSVPVTQVDPADHQHMVTFTIAFGVSGSLDTSLYATCGLVGGSCPDPWPGTGSDSGKIDDMFHAAVNGRGQFIAANNNEELVAALEALGKDIDSRLGSAAALATNSIQRQVGSVIYQGTYNSANWWGEVSALPIDWITGAVGLPIPPYGWRPAVPCPPGTCAISFLTMAPRAFFSMPPA